MADIVQKAKVCKVLAYKITLIFSKQVQFEVDKTRKQAESLVSKRLTQNDYPAALEACVQAAELYLQAWKLCPQADEKKRLRDKFTNLLQQGEDIKKGKAKTEEDPTTDNAGSITKGVGPMNITESKSTSILSTQVQYINLEIAL